MQRRSAKRTTPRKQYTVDAFKGIEDLLGHVSDDNRTSKSPPAVEPNDEFQPQEDVDVNEDLDDEAGLEDLVDEESDVVASDDAIDLSDGAPTPATRRRNRRRSSPLATAPVYKRGLEDASSLLFLPRLANKTTGKVVKIAHETWASQPALPSRNADAYIPRPLDIEPAQSTADSTWYTEGSGKVAFSKQVCTQLSASVTNAFLTASNPLPATLLVGPHTKPTTLHLKPGQISSLSHVFPRNRRSAFIINLGSRITHLEWVPNCEGQEQYLTLATAPPNPPISEVLQSPAFNPQPPSKSNIQIWAIPTARRPGASTGFPQLTLCTEWGHAVAFQWCPFVSATRDSLGLLAAVWADGDLRVLDVPFPSGAPQSIQITSTPFEFKGPDAIFTCVTWLSPSSIAAGCANGFVAIFDLARYREDDDSTLRPIVYSAMVDTYVATVASCYPSHPHMLMVTSAAGHLGIVDLSRPSPGSSHSTMAFGQRPRMGGSPVAWNDFAQCVVGMDDNFNVRGQPIRRLQSTVALARTNGAITAIATSLLHPFVLLGGADGNATCFNPMRKVLDPKAVTHKQTWFAHEWRADNELEGGISKMSEGYKPEAMGVPKLGKGGKPAKGEASWATVYEEKSAVVSMAWNPNRHAHGWAAAGMGNGVVRVENIAV